MCRREKGGGSSIPGSEASMELLVHSSFTVPPFLQRERSFVCQGRRIQSMWLRRHFPCRLGDFSSKCSVVDADSRCIILENKTPQDLISCSDILPPLTSDFFNPISFKLLKGDNFINSYSSAFVTVEEPDALAATPAHPAGLYALYASYLAGNLVEQLWNFAWPTAVATLYPSFLSVAIVGFFAKLSVFIGAPVVGNLMDHFPRIPAYHSLNIIQTVAQLLSATMIIHALKSASCTSASAVIFQPWFLVLVVVGAIERLAGLALGVTVEREWVVLLAGIDKPVALARANAILNRIDLLTEIIGASIFGILLSKFCTVTCLKLASGLMICALPALLILGEFINWRSSGVLEDSKLSLNSDNSLGVKPFLSTGKIVQNGFKSIKKGWMEYRNLPVLPASLAYVLLYFNIALAPGSIMTAFLLHHGVSPSIIGGFSGLSAFMGVAATFISASLVEKLGILQAGAAGLVFQSLLLAAALGVFCVGSFSKQKPLFFFLVLIVLSRLGHMSYDVVGTQILQTGIPMSMANLIGTTETSIASLAEFAMLGVAIIANDVRYFGVLALLSFSSVVGAACMFCWWLRNLPNE